MMKFINRMNWLIQIELIVPVIIAAVFMAILNLIPRFHFIYRLKWNRTSRLLTDELS
ncbi:hypothetical protein [Legionella quateirensis]|uniref:hypothetical protein n=1 Tax=Legionella quateirensis TaxID=45072 RepID=UPI0012EE7FE9|nr:hypothetical protein [Legionella quateirensis]